MPIAPDSHHLLFADALDAAAALRRGVALTHVDSTEQPAALTGAEPMLISVESAAERLSVSRSTMWSLVSAGSVPSIKVGRRRLIPVGELRALVAEWARTGTVG
jgi:excisionase family DNA binding protein